ncbi:hypothetical protein SAMN05518856_101279 [Paenibacillus sp. OK003]|nr:hypothetical protein SAMN05518856_101279 [Paenibacillus sp. OK003]
MQLCKGYNKGFLAKWIGAPYFGKGYNQRGEESLFRYQAINDLEQVYDTNDEIYAPWYAKE